MLFLSIYVLKTCSNKTWRTWWTHLNLEHSAFFSEGKVQSWEFQPFKRGGLHLLEKHLSHVCLFSGWMWCEAVGWHQLLPFRMRNFPRTLSLVCQISKLFAQNCNDRQLPVGLHVFVWQSGPVWTQSLCWRLSLPPKCISLGAFFSKIFRYFTKKKKNSVDEFYYDHLSSNIRVCSGA